VTRNLRFLGFADLGGGFAEEIAEVVELGATSETGLFDFDFDYNWSIEGEDLLDTDRAGCDLADDKSGVIFGVDGDDYPFEDLDTRLVTLFDSLVYADGVADVESGVFVCN